VVMRLDWPIGYLAWLTWARWLRYRLCVLFGRGGGRGIGWAGGQYVCVNGRVLSLVCRYLLWVQPVCI